MHCKFLTVSFRRCLPHCCIREEHSKMFDYSYSTDTTQSEWRQAPKEETLAVNNQQEHTGVCQLSASPGCI